jgi:hypothetical protein
VTLLPQTMKSVKVIPVLERTRPPIRDRVGCGTTRPARSRRRREDRRGVHRG